MKSHNSKWFGTFSLDKLESESRVSEWVRDRERERERDRLFFLVFQLYARVCPLKEGNKLRWTDKCCKRNIYISISIWILSIHR